ncbi:MAG TPA: hypothetical protein VKB53_12110 [Gammaproteobacteria bacterium]|jgi:hypothetical protein|nr:hypothetical protein [Gammaproteobacteria bacterium]HKH21601.1 hypothetical protein [Gammaproteobacteria bacterium]
MHKVIPLRPDLYARAEQLLQRAGRIPVWDDSKQFKCDLNVDHVMRLLRMVEAQYENRS